MYRALSYAWDDPKSGDSITFIRINGYNLSVGLNLFSALDQLAKLYKGDLLWIDRLCINQQDDDERGRLVARMDKVYRNATEVIIWLGPSTDRTGAVFDLVNKVAQVKEELFEKENLFGPTFLQDNGLNYAGDNIWRDDYLELYERRWFSRGWVVQEVVLAQHAVVLCGHHRIDWTILRDGSKIFQPDHFQVKLFKDPGSGTFRARGRNIHRIRRIEEFYKEQDPKALLVVEVCTGSREIAHPEVVLLHFMRMSRDFKWKESKDRIYSMIGIIRALNWDLDTVPDYKDTTTPASVFTSFAKSIIERSGHVGIISQVSDLGNREVKHLPSWVPCFRLPPNYANGRKHPFCADQAVRSTGYALFTFLGDSLQVSGIKVGRIWSTQQVDIDSPSNITKLRSLARKAFQPKGIDHDEVLWRTLVQNIYGMHSTFGDEYYAPSEIGAWYRCWVHVAARHRVRDWTVSVA